MLGAGARRGCSALLAQAAANHVGAWSDEGGPAELMPWLDWAWHWLCWPVAVITAAFRWHPADNDGPLSAAAGEVPHPAADTPLLRMWGQLQGVAGYVPAPFETWAQLWKDNPEGSFLFDHWIAVLLAACVLAISACSLCSSLARYQLTNSS